MIIESKKDKYDALRELYAIQTLSNIRTLHTNVEHYWYTMNFISHAFSYKNLMDPKGSTKSKLVCLLLIMNQEAKETTPEIVQHYIDSFSSGEIPQPLLPYFLKLLFIFGSKPSLKKYISNFISYLTKNIFSICSTMPIMMSTCNTFDN